MRKKKAHRRPTDPIGPQQIRETKASKMRKLHTKKWIEEQQILEALSNQEEAAAFGGPREGRRYYYYGEEDDYGNGFEDEEEEEDDDDDYDNRSTSSRSVSSSSLSRTQASAKPTIIAGLRAFLASGRFIVTTNVCPTTSVKRCSVPDIISP